MLRKLAIAISIVMHPLLMPTLLFALLFYYVPEVTNPISREAALHILLAIFITTFVLPMISIMALRLSSIMMTSKLAVLSMPGRKDRVLPFFFTSMFYIITTYMFFSNFRVNQAVVVILAGTTVIILLISMVTLFFKVSTHSASAGGLMGFLIGLGFRYPQEQIMWPLMLILMLGGLAMSARLYLNEHKPIGILVGWVMGLTISLGSILIFIP